jgi:hypothetical protein
MLEIALTVLAIVAAVTIVWRLYERIQNRRMVNRTFDRIFKGFN